MTSGFMQQKALQFWFSSSGKTAATLKKNEFYVFQEVDCVRALLWTSCKETKRAIYDLNYGLQLNPSHICTLILRGVSLSLLEMKIISLSVKIMKT